MADKIYTRKGVVINDDVKKPELPPLRRVKCSIENNPSSEIRITIPLIATRNDILRAIKHLQTEADIWED